MVKLLAAVLLVLAIMAAPIGTAFSFGPMEVFAKTHNDAVSWKTNVTIETNHLAVRANSILISGQEWEIRPDSGDTIQVNIEQWGVDWKRFRVLILSGAPTGLNVTVSNPGLVLSIIQDGVAAFTCPATNATCYWTLASSSTPFNFSIATPAGAQANIGGLPPPAEQPAAVGGGGSSGPIFDEPQVIPDPFLQSVRPPQEVFPEFSFLQWTGFAFGIFLVSNGSKRTRAFLVPRLRLAGPPAAFLGMGVILTIFSYLI